MKDKRKDPQNFRKPMISLYHLAVRNYYLNQVYMHVHGVDLKLGEDIMRGKCMPVAKKVLKI